jgi:hypothetical protein
VALEEDAATGEEEDTALEEDSDNAPPAITT